MLPFLTSSRAISFAGLASVLLFAGAAQASSSSPSDLPQCQFSRMRREISSKLPWWAREDTTVQRVDFTSFVENRFTAQSDNNLWEINLTKDRMNPISSKLHLVSKFKQPTTHHRKRMVHIKWLLKSMHSVNGALVPEYEESNVYLNDGDECFGQKAGSIPPNVDKIDSVTLFTLNALK